MWEYSTINLNSALKSKHDKFFFYNTTHGCLEEGAPRDGNYTQMPKKKTPVSFLLFFYGCALFLVGFSTTTVDF